MPNMLHSRRSWSNSTNAELY